eukprot:TRINITY_DN1677_c0_g1_i1.p1 TRINITY_DN1677_c0_g1~~TRINITY_DN1677_c0_g1_i1.p1  ORF type:complete len:304 (+),score=28.72 TRINITY_DN1677_c0_g1_i1:88-999(+)
MGSPRRRSRSPREDRSHRRAERSRSDRDRDRPRHSERERSDRHRARSPSRRHRSPQRTSRRSPSPRRRHSRSPRRYSPRRQRSPRRRSTSPAKKDEKVEKSNMPSFLRGAISEVQSKKAKEEEESRKESESHLDRIVQRSESDEEKDGKIGSSSPLVHPDRRSAMERPNNEEKAKHIRDFEMPRANEDVGPDNGGTKEGENFGLSGLLSEKEENLNGVKLVWHEPNDSCIPRQKWRLYIFKGNSQVEEPLHIHRESCLRIGREKRVCKLHLLHPSCSKQHSVIQFRKIEIEDQDTFLTKTVVR